MKYPKENVFFLPNEFVFTVIDSTLNRACLRMTRMSFCDSTRLTQVMTRLEKSLDYFDLKGVAVDCIVLNY